MAALAVWPGDSSGVALGAPPLSGGFLLLGLEGPQG